MPLANDLRRESPPTRHPVLLFDPVVTANRWNGHLNLVRAVGKGAILTPVAGALLEETTHCSLQRTASRTRRCNGLALRARLAPHLAIAHVHKVVEASSFVMDAADT